MKNSFTSKVKKIATIGAIIAPFFICANANAIELEQVSLRGGSLGLGAEVGFEVLPTLIVRGIAQKFDYDYDNEIDGINYKGTLGLGSYGVQADFHPPLIPFYLTAGIFNNDNNIDLAANSSATYQIGDTTYTGAQIGTLNSKVEFEKTALYGGLGAEFQVGPVGLVFEGGIFYQGDPKVTMSATGSINDNADFKSNAAKESAKIADEIDAAKYWPALTIMGRWKF